MKLLLVSSILEVAHERPEGYVEDVLQSGQVINDENGQPWHVVIHDAKFDELVTKYAPHIAELAKRPQVGPGTELKKLLATVGINATPNCSCNARAAEMDRQGADWCEANIDTIVGWLREEAEKRGLPFLDVAGRLLVKRAIRNARRAAAS